MDKSKHAIKIGIGVFVGILLLIAVIKLFINATLPDLSEIQGSKTETIHGMNYEIPESWSKDDSISTDILHRYVKKQNNKIIAIAEVSYTGESDLTSGDVAYKDEHICSDDIFDLIPNATGTFQEIKADNSVFEVSIYIDQHIVKGKSGFLSFVADSFKTDSYKNPRKSIGIEAVYIGSRIAGVTIDSNCEDIIVIESFDTGTGQGSKELEWTIDKPITLEAGKISSIVINIGEKTKTLKVECSTMNVN